MLLILELCDTTIDIIVSLHKRRTYIHRYSIDIESVKDEINWLSNQIVELHKGHDYYKLYLKKNRYKIEVRINDLNSELDYLKNVLIPELT